VQKFKPTSGRALGVLGIGVMVLLIGYIAATEHDLLALRVSLGLGILALLIWMTLLRPRADAYEDSLVLHNMVSDTRVPMASIDAVVVRHTLNVFIDEDRYTCVGIGRSSRSMLNRRTPGPMALLGAGQPDEGLTLGQSAKIGAGAEYANFVETRIDGLARAARRDALDVPPVRRTWAVPELLALGVLGVGLVLSLLL
jgi:hypothetical protein